MMKDDDFKLLGGFGDGLTDRQTDGQTDICDCRVAFATENYRFWLVVLKLYLLPFQIFWSILDKIFQIHQKSNIQISKVIQPSLLKYPDQLTCSQSHTKYQNRRGVSISDHAASLI